MASVGRPKMVVTSPNLDFMRAQINRSEQKLSGSRDWESLDLFATPTAAWMRMPTQQ